MSATIKNISSMRSVSSPVVLGINTGKKITSTQDMFSQYTSSTTSKKWYRQASHKMYCLDWDINKCELEFE